MNEIIIYILVIIASLAIIVFANNISDNRCKKAGGQIIINTTNYGHGCICPAK